MPDQPAARLGDAVVGVDIHVVLVPSPTGTAPTPLPHPFSGTITSSTVSTVLIGGQPAAVVGSVATNSQPHVPTPPGTSFSRPPANRGTVSSGSSTVLADGKRLARLGDRVRTCNDPLDRESSVIQSGATSVLVGG
jgi:uncharacterized Zn-binding protein involved in type VI secretion